MQRNVTIGTLFVVLLAGVRINVSSLLATSQPGPRGFSHWLSEGR